MVLTHANTGGCNGKSKDAGILNRSLPHFLRWAKVFANSPKRSEYMKEMKSGASLVAWLLIGHVAGMVVRIGGSVPKQLQGSDTFRFVTFCDSASIFGLPAFRRWWRIL